MMYRARLKLQPKIPMCALDFSTIIKECPTFNQFFRKTVIIGDQCSVIFFSESMKENLSNATNLYFDEHLRSALNNSINFGLYLLILEDIFCTEFTAC